MKWGGIRHILIMLWFLIFFSLSLSLTHTHTYTYNLPVNCSVILLNVTTLSPKDVADKVRIQYGGSVSPDNVDDLMSQVRKQGSY